MVKKCKYETLEKNNSDSEDLMKEISGNEIQLKQLLINEDVLINRSKELQKNRDQIITKIKRNASLADKWITFLATEIENQKDIVHIIATDGDVILPEAQKLSSTQQEIIQKLKEQLEIRDTMIGQVKKKIEEQGKEINIGELSEILSFEEICKISKDEHNSISSKNAYLPNVHYQNSINHGEKLFTKVAQYTKIPRKLNDYKKKDPKDEKRSYSVVSQNSSFSTGASSGAVQAIKIGSLLAKQAKHLSRRGPTNLNKISHSKLMNAGAHIAIGPTRFLLSSDKLPFMATSDIKNIKPAGLKSGKKLSKFVDEE